MPARKIKEEPSIHMEDIVDKHLKTMNLSSAEQILLKECMQQVWSEEFLGGSFIEVQDGIIIHFDKKNRKKSRHILYSKKEGYYENTETHEQYPFDQVRSVSLKNIADQIISLFRRLNLCRQLKSGMAQA